MQIEPRDFSIEILNLEKLITSIQTTVFFTIGTLVAIIALGIALGGWALKVLARKWVDETVDQELDRRLIDLLKNNQPVFNASGTSIPDANNKIYLSEAIQGIDHLETDNVISLNVNPENLTWDDIQGNKKPKINRNELGIVEIEIPEYHKNNGLIHWQVAWVRKHYDIK